MAASERNAAAETKAVALEDFDTLWNYNDPAATEARFRELLPVAEQRADSELHAQLLTQIARTQGLQRLFAEAQSTLDQAAKLITDSMPLARARWLLEQGRLLNSSGRRAESVPVFREALRVSEGGAFEFFAIDAAHMLGIASEPQEALDWNLKAIAMAEAAREKRARGWLGSLYNNTGWTLHDQGEYARALDLFERALAWREEQGQGAEIRIAKWCVARCLRSLGRTEEALARQQALQAELVAAGVEQDGYVYEELAECLHALGKTDEARPWFRRAHAVLSQDPWLQEQEPARLERLAELGGPAD